MLVVKTVFRKSASGRKMPVDGATGVRYTRRSADGIARVLPNLFRVQLLHQPRNNVVARDAFGLGVEGCENSMS